MTNAQCAAAGSGGTTLTLCGRVNDDDGGVSEFEEAVTNASIRPKIGPVQCPTEPVALGRPIELSASFTDASEVDQHTAVWDWGDESSTTQDDATSPVGAQHSYSEPGVYRVVLTVSDASGASQTVHHEYAVVYDPDGGFVTGGGWIDSPAGAYTADPTLTGKATFGFVAKYKKGANVPEGSTEYQFKAGTLNFHSSSYEWLIVAGHDRAKFKGEGTINGSGSYKFMLTAIDGDPDEPDKFHIKLWGDNGVVYDNLAGSDDDEYDGTVLGGGNIKVHKTK